MTDEQREQAFKEGERNEAGAKYFDARFFYRISNQQAFDAGFDRGWDSGRAPLLERIAEMETDRDRLEKYWNEALATHENIAALKSRFAELEAKLAQQAPEAPKQASNWLHLKRYGYAPGGYMCKCAQCGQVAYDLDKRAATCRPCAEALHAKAIAQQAEAQEPCAWLDDFGNAFPLRANKGAGSWMDEHKRNWRPLFTRPQPAQPINQCDGCRRGLPIVNGLHDGGPWDKMVCQAGRY